MGLDMYLYASHYVSGVDWADCKAKTSPAMKKLLRQAGLRVSDIKFGGNSGAVVDFPVGYWRKTNAVHAWFVANCQKGVDDCRRSYVQREQLKELLDLCEKTLKDVKNADKTLPTQPGFFFGSTDYGDYYVEDLKYTVKMLKAILKNKRLEKCDFYYRSSW